MQETNILVLSWDLKVDVHRYKQQWHIMIHFYCSPLEQDTLKVQNFFFYNVQM